MITRTQRWKWGPSCTPNHQKLAKSKAHRRGFGQAWTGTLALPRQTQTLSCNKHYRKPSQCWLNESLQIMPEHKEMNGSIPSFNSFRSQDLSFLKKLKTSTAFIYTSLAHICICHIKLKLAFFKYENTKACTLKSPEKASYSWCAAPGKPAHN